MEGLSPAQVLQKIVDAYPECLASDEFQEAYVYKMAYADMTRVRPTGTWYGASDVLKHNCNQKHANLFGLYWNDEGLLCKK